MKPINFTANYLTSTYVTQIKDDKPSKEEVSIVELDTNNSNDIEALNQTATDWDKKSYTFARQIYHDAIKDFQYNDVNKEHYYVLTKQSEDFDNLKSDKILGLMLLSEMKSGKNRIDWLQVEPDSSSYTRTSKIYKGLGTSLVNFAKEQSKNKIIDVCSDKYAIEFYEKQGFQHIPNEIEASMYYEA